MQEEHPHLHSRPEAHVQSCKPPDYHPSAYYQVISLLQPLVLKISEDRFLCTARIEDQIERCLMDERVSEALVWEWMDLFTGTQGIPNWL